jgi:hypothetical protein
MLRLQLPHGVVSGRAHVKSTGRDRNRSVLGGRSRVAGVVGVESCV